MEQEVRISMKEGQGIMIGVDVAVFDSAGRVLLGKRLSKVGYGQWGFPGGHLKQNEKLLDAADREIDEELGCGIEIEVSKKVLVAREDRLEPYRLHHITIILEGKHIGGEAMVNEPLRCEKWEWFDYDNLPESLFAGIKEALDNQRNNESTVITGLNSF
ncbi:MAG: NUDIX domain-containing protein [Parcubacteria group bacterium]|jgi:8-oxo-dGTP diphosphatase